MTIAQKEQLKLLAEYVQKAKQAKANWLAVHYLYLAKSFLDHLIRELEND